MNDDPTYPEEPHELVEDPLYVMTVELEKGKSESIKIYPDSNPKELAYEFCKKNNLDYVSLDYLSHQIARLFNSVSSRQTAKTDCISEKEGEEDNQANERRRDNTGEHRLYYISDGEDHKVAPCESKCAKEEEKKNKREEDVANEEVTRQSIDKLIKKKSSPDYSALFSYEEFYNRFKRRHEEREQRTASSKKNKEDSTHQSKCISTPQLLSKEPSSPKILSIADNERRYNEFLQQYDNLDEIYQNERCSMNKYNKQSGTNNQTESFPFSKSQGNVLNAYQCSNSNNLSSTKYQSCNSIELKSNAQRIQISNQPTFLTHKAMKDNTLSQKLQSRSRTLTYSNSNIGTAQSSIRSNKLNIKFIKGSITYSDKYKGMSKTQQSQTPKHYNQKKEYALFNKDHKESTAVDAVFNKKKEEIFRKIFHLLDSNQDSTISILTMNTSRIPSTIYTIIKPLMQDIKPSDIERINENEFVQGCMRLFERLPFNNRRALLDFSTKIRPI